MDVVGSILDGVKAEVAAALGVGYQELAYKDAIADNEEDQAQKAYGVRAGASSPAPGVNRVITADQIFEIILTDVFTDDSSDEESDTLLRTMYSNAVAIFQRLVNTRAGAASYVINVTEPAFQAPQIFPDQAIVSLRMQVTIRWRVAL